MIETFTARARKIPYAFSMAAWLILECARRTSTFSACAFREQEDDQAAHPILLRPHVARARETNRLPSLTNQPLTDR